MSEPSLKNQGFGESLPGDREEEVVSAGPASLRDHDDVELEKSNVLLLGPTGFSLFQYLPSPFLRFCLPSLLPSSVFPSLLASILPFLCRCTLQPCCSFSPCMTTLSLLLPFFSTFLTYSFQPPGSSPASPPLTPPSHFLTSVTPPSYFVFPVSCLV